MIVTADCAPPSEPSRRKLRLSRLEPLHFYDRILVTKQKKARVSYIPQYETGVQEVLPEGDYDFVVDDAGEKESTRGNAMIELQLAIEHDGSRVRVFDHLVFTRNAFWKIDAFRICTGEKLVEGQKINLALRYSLLITWLGKFGAV